MNGRGAEANEADALPLDVKPVALVADALRDTTTSGGLVLDPFLRSGTTIAAEEVGRRCYGIEYEPAVVDLAIQRWEAYTNRHATLIANGLAFSEVEAERCSGIGPTQGGSADDGGGR